MTIYLQNFKKKRDIISAYQPLDGALTDAEILLAWHGYGDYCGSSLVIFRKDGKLYEVHGGHCSCYGLEGQWQPEETTAAALGKRDYFSTGCDGAEELKKEYFALVRRLKREEDKSTLDKSKN